jgi:hypothetical protein
MKTKRIIVGFGWGIEATIAMSVLMLIGVLTGISPMPMPIPVAIAGHLFGQGTPRPLLLAVAILSHLAYGGVWAAILVAVVSRVTVWKSIGWGLFLWLIMQVFFLPWLGWGLLGTAITPRIALATLVLHLVYGATLGWLAVRERAVHAVGASRNPYDVAGAPLDSQS